MKKLAGLLILLAHEIRMGDSTLVTLRVEVKESILMIAGYSTSSKVIDAFSYSLSLIRAHGFRDESHALSRYFTGDSILESVISKIPATSFRNSVNVPEILRVKNEFYKDIPNQR